MTGNNIQSEYTSMLLQITSSTIEQLTELRQQKGEDFNIFSILEMERKEVGTHSKFIYELLNPRGSHYQKTRFADLFIEKVLKLENAGAIKKIKREDVTETNRRIDFTIATENYLIGIEMKIDAGDQESQLYDYHQELIKRTGNSGQQPALFYLTLNGIAPSKYSTKTLKSENIHCISFRNDILEWLEACIETVALKPVISELLNQYRLVIKKLTHQDKGLDMKIAEEISHNKNNLLAAEQITKSYLLAIKKIETNLLNSLIMSVQNISRWKPDCRGLEDPKDVTQRYSDGWIWIIYKIGRLKQDESKCIYAVIAQASNHDYLRLAVFIGMESNPEKIDIQKIDESLRDEITTNLLDKLKGYSIKKNYKWGDFVNGCLDDSFKLEGTENLSRWIGVTSESKEVIEIAQIVKDSLDKVKSAVSCSILKEEAHKSNKPISNNRAESLAV